MKTKLNLLLILLSFSVLAQVQPFKYGGDFTGTVTIQDSISVEGVINVPDATLATHAPNLGQVQEMIDASSSVVVVELDPFTLPAMSSPPNQNSFSPIDLVTATLTAGFIDWEITWTDSGYTYKASAIGDYNLQIRESGGKVQIGGQTRSQSDVVVTSGMNPKLILTYPQNNQ